LSENASQSDESVFSVSESAAENYFEFRGVNKAFDDHAVLKDVSFTVKRGETCVIMGRSGVGKSVSLKHILGFLKADSGRIFIDGQDVTDYSEGQFAEIRKKVTMVFQSGALFDSLTVFENIAFPLEDQPGLTEQDVDAYVDKLRVCWKWKTRWISCRVSCPLDYGARWPSRERWRKIQKPFSTTSRPRWLIRSWPRTWAI